MCEEFSLELYDILEEVVECSDKERFFIFTCVGGEGIIISGDNKEEIKKGDSFLVPASLGEYTLKGNMKLLKSYVPDVNKIKNEILKKLNKNSTVLINIKAVFLYYINSTLTKFNHNNL
ncbi:hypothetical protein CF065_12810 [Clostridium sporogenes]